MAWRILTALLLAGLLDVLLPWPVWLRGAFVFGGAGALVLGLRRVRQHSLALMSRPAAQIARVVETTLPELDNALIHAVQFGPLLTLSVSPSGAAWMRREVARAETALAALSPAAWLPAAPLRQARRALLLAVGAVLLTALLFPRACRFELPRFLQFWQDAPPFTLTDFVVIPPGATLRAGDNLTITVRVGGLRPRTLQLVSEPEGTGSQSLPLTLADADTYTAQLESLTRPTQIYVLADTGRSARYRISIAPPDANANGKTTPLKENGEESEKRAKGGNRSGGSADEAARTRAVRDLMGGQSRLARQIQRAADAPTGKAKGTNSHGQSAKPPSLSAAMAGLRQQQTALANRALAQSLRAGAGGVKSSDAPLKSAPRSARRAQALDRAAQIMQEAARAPDPAAMLRFARRAAQQLSRALPPANPDKARPDGKSPASDALPSSTSGGNHSGSVVVIRTSGTAGGTVTPALPTVRASGGQAAPDQAGTPDPVTDATTARYPAEYRRLVRDYFRAVAGGH